MGIGGNEGDSRALFASARKALDLIPSTRVVAVSSLYKTPPMGSADQAEYSNAVIELETLLPPLALLDELQAVEQAHGRVRKKQRWGPRTLDLDILLFGDRVIDEPRLIVPHYGMKERVFVLQPLAELLGLEAELPGLGRLENLLAAAKGQRIENLGAW